MAQVDPSAALLLRKSKNIEKDYSSSRYTVKPKQGDEAATPTSSLQPVRKPQVFTIKKPQKKKPQVQVIVEKKAQQKKLIPVTEDVEKYKSYLHANDKRNSIIEFSLGINYIYQDSSSRYWTRDFFSSSSGIDADINLWLTPFLGIKASYTTSLSAELRSAPSGLEYLDVDHNWFTAGLRFRKFFGYTRKAKALNFGVDFYEYQFEVPTSATQRISSQSKGVSLSVEADLPSTSTDSWLVGFELQPRLSHSEIKSTSDIQSGSSNSSNSMGFWLGQKLRFDRKNQVYWKVFHRIEKNKFSGVTEASDPQLGAVITGVGVTNSFTFFQLGFTWGR